MAIVRANNRMGIRSVMAAGRARGGQVGGGGGGGGAGRGGVMGPFGNENETEAGGFVGPFGWGGGLTEGAKAARAAHAQFNEDEQNALGNLSNELAQGKSIGEALRSNPDDLKTLMRGGHLQDFANLQKILQPSGGKGFNLGPGQQHFNDQGQMVAENPNQPGTIQDLGTDENGNHLFGRYGSRGQTPGITATKPQATHSQLEWVTNPDGSRTLTAVNKDTGASAVIGAPGGGASLTSAPKSGNFSVGEQNELNSVEQLGPAIKALQRYSGVTGVLEGIPAWVAGKKLGFGQEAQPFFSNLETATAFINGLSTRSTRIGHEMSNLQNLLPNATNASSYNIGENVPQLMLAYRRAVSSLASEAQRKNINDQTLNGLVKEYNATPDQMQSLDHAINQTRANGGSGLTDQDIHTLVKNSEDLPVSVKTVTIGQGASRGMIPVDTWNNWASKHPQMTGVTHPGNMQGAPDQVAPANPGPPSARSPSTPQAQPPGPQAPTTSPPMPSGSVRPPSQTLQLPPQGQGQPIPAPTNADQQSQLPQQLQQMQGQMAPPGGAAPNVIPPGGAYAPIPPRQPGQP